MKVTAALKGLIDTNGHQPIQIRIFHNGKYSHKPTHIKVEPKQFEDGRVKPSHPKAKEYNRIIETLIIQYQAQTITATSAPKKKSRTYLFDYIDVTIKQLEHVRRPGTVRVYLSQLEKLKAFTPNALLSQIDSAFLYSYQSHLIKLGNSKNTIWSSFKFLRTIINKAVSDDLLDKSPFKKFPMPKYEETNKNYLSKEEVKAIDKFCLDKHCPKELVFAGTWFLIACNTGLRLGDLRAFNKQKNIHSGRLVVKTSKTGDIIGLPISEKLKGYFERIKYEPLNMSGEQYNRLLKLVAMGSGIVKKVSSHTARHTAAMTWANNGIEREVIAEMLGHSDLRSTKTYAKISNKRIDNELKKVK